MSFKITLHQQIDRFNHDGKILAPDGNINEAAYWNFMKWQCETSNLSTKAAELMKLAKNFTDAHPELHKGKYYLWFKNSVSVNKDSVDEIHISDGKKDIYTIRKMKRISPSN